MDLESAIQISASGLKANRTWINVLSSNLANMNTTKTAEGGPYTRKTVIYETAPSEGFTGELRAAMSGGADKVQVADIVSDQRDFKQVYDPGNPDADAKGIVLMPNINPVEEMANLITASRSYEANLAALQTSRQLALKSMEIGAK
ncbi:MAG TPA: flagellar basal body rod protein FlgC [Deltaproteobacteria bacterium]|jgi:flagellar basal-body rod protein FlgC|nr:flagellar basal body rod protein FlgC [Deltaproteobacteria bacterium]